MESPSPEAGGGDAGRGGESQGLSAKGELGDDLTEEIRLAGAGRTGNEDLREEEQGRKAQEDQPEYLETKTETEAGVADRTDSPLRTRSRTAFCWSPRFSLAIIRGLGSSLCFCPSSVLISFESGFGTASSGEGW
jgi:hypothetical protein